MHLAVNLAGGGVGPAIVGSHDRLHAGADGAVIALGVDIGHVGFGDGRHALVDAIVGRAIAHEVLGGGDDIAGLCEVALQARRIGGGIGAHFLRVGREAFIGAAPAFVLDDGNGRGKGPVDAGGAHGLAGRLADLGDQFGVVGGAQADIVGKKGGAIDIRMAVDGVGAPEQRDLRLRVEGVGHLHPVAGGGVLVHVRPRSAAVQHRAERVGLDVGGGDGLDLDLRHLGDLLAQRHALHQAGDLGFDFGVRRDGGGDVLPVGGRCLCDGRQGQAERGGKRDGGGGAQDGHRGSSRPFGHPWKAKKRGKKREGRPNRLG